MLKRSVSLDWTWNHSGPELEIIHFTPFVLGMWKLRPSEAAASHHSPLSSINNILHHKGGGTSKGKGESQGDRNWREYEAARHDQGQQLPRPTDIHPQPPGILPSEGNAGELPFRVNQNLLFPNSQSSSHPQPYAPQLQRSDHASPIASISILPLCRLCC